MNLNFQALLFIAFTSLMGLSCQEDPPGITYDPFVDCEGNVYPIGKMCDGKIWMLKNLSVSKFANGDTIPYVYHEHWIDFGDDSPAHCTVLDSAELEGVYGQLYNWYAVSDPRGLAPEGWHVATLEEWQALIDCNGGNALAGDQLKEAGSVHWNTATGTNASGFTALPGGRRIGIEDELLGMLAVFWTSEPNKECFGTVTPYYGTYDGQASAYTNCGVNGVGASVRCVRDE